MGKTEIVNSTIRSFDESLPMALLRAREAAMAHFRPLLAKHDLTEQQWRVLRALNAATEPIDVGALVDATSLLAPSLTRILAKLSDDGLIERETHADDQRRSAISLTANGLGLVSEVAPKSEAAYAMIEKSFGKRRLHTLMDELNDLATAITLEEDPEEDQ